MYSKRRYKTCICAVVLGGQLKSFRNYLGPQYYFPENFRCNFRFYESENFSDSSLHRSFESENFRFPFSTKNRLTWRLKCEKLNFRKSQGIYQISYKTVHEWKSHLEIFSLPQVIENCRLFLFLRTDILQKTVVGCPCLSSMIFF